MLDQLKILRQPHTMDVALRKGDEING